MRTSHRYLRGSLASADTGPLCHLRAAGYVTGLVHTAPGHGEDDYETGIREKLDVYSPVLANGQFDDTAPEWLRGKPVHKVCAEDWIDRRSVKEDDE